MKYIKKFSSSGAMLIVISILIVWVIESVQNSGIKAIFGIFILIVLPGYFTFKLLVPSSSERNLGYIILIVLVLGIIETIVVSYLLNFLPWGINTRPILYFHLLIIIVTWAVTYFRGSEMEGYWPGNIQLGWKASHKNRLGGLDIILVFTLACSIAIYLIALVYAIYSPGPKEKFTEFYVLNREGEFGNYGNYLDENGNINVTVVVENYEYENLFYRIEVINGVDKVVLGETKVLDGEVWSLNVSLEINDPNIVILLYKENNAEPYRYLHLNLGT